jgi:hypothetical protein
MPCVRTLLNLHPHHFEIFESLHSFCHNIKARYYCLVMYRYNLWAIVLCTGLISIVTGCEILPNGDRLCCAWDEPFIANPSDCVAAINMIPAGIPEPIFVQYGIPKKPISLEMDHNGGRDLRLPAAFLAGSCAISVKASLRPQSFEPRPPEQAATAMYYNIWPNVKTTAIRILKLCIEVHRFPDLPKSESGTMLTKSTLNDWVFNYEVQVRGAPEATPKPGNNESDWLSGYHIYRGKAVPLASRGPGKVLRRQATNLAGNAAFATIHPIR